MEHRPVQRGHQQHRGRSADRRPQGQPLPQQRLRVRHRHRIHGRWQRLQRIPHVRRHQRKTGTVGQRHPQHLAHLAETQPADRRRTPEGARRHRPQRHRHHHRPPVETQRPVAGCQPAGMAPHRRTARDRWQHHRAGRSVPARLRQLAVHPQPVAQTERRLDSADPQLLPAERLRRQRPQTLRKPLSAGSGLPRHRNQPHQHPVPLRMVETARSCAGHR